MRLLSSVFVLAVVLISASASAQSWTPEQQELWKLEEEIWQRDVSKDVGWVSTYMHPDATSWGIDQPVPRNRASVAKWDKYAYGNSTVLEHELFPLSIVISGDVAIVHFRYRSASENARKEREVTTGRYTDVLVRKGGRWLILATVGGDDPRSGK